MSDEIDITQRAGKESTQIGVQNNYNSALSVEDIVETAFILFREQYPKLRAEALAEVRKLVEEEVAKIDIKDIVSPRPKIVAEVLQNASTTEETVLREMYAKVLSGDMNKSQREYIHPAYAEIIKQLCADEAKILQKFSDCDYLPTITLSVQNNKGEQSTADRNFSDVLEEFDGNEEEAFKMDGSFVEVNDDVEKLQVIGSNFEVVFSKHSGILNRYIVDGTDLLVGGPKLNLYRARIDNDAWEEENYDLFDTQNNSDVSDVKTLIREDCVELIVQGNIRTSELSPYTTTYTMYPNGMVKVKLDVTVNGSEDTTLKRVGMKMDVDPSFEQCTYYGKGPYGNYVDRKSGSFVDLYAMTVQEMDEMNVYQRPQSNGNHSDVRFVCVSDDESGLFVVGDHLNMSYSQYEEESYDWMRHMYEVKKAPYNVLRIDLAQKGLGNASYGPKELKQYALPYGSYSYSYVLCPYDGEDVFALYKQARGLMNVR